MQEMTSSDCDCIAAVHNDKHDNDDSNGKNEDDGEDLHDGIFQEIFDYIAILATLYIHCSYFGNTHGAFTVLIY